MIYAYFCGRSRLYSSMRHNLYMVFNVGGRYAQKIIKIILHFFFQNKGYPFFKLNTFKLTFTIFIFVLSYQSREKERAELNEVTNPWTAYFGHMHTNVTWRNLMDKWTKHIYVAQTIPFYLTHLKPYVMNLVAHPTCCKAAQTFV